MSAVLHAWISSIHVLDRKLARDAMRLWGQLLAAALVMASGVAVLVMSHFLFATLDATKNAYYERFAFADVFASSQRAPLRLADEIRSIPGVRSAEPRIRGQAQLDLPGVIEPARAALVSLPDFADPAVNRLVVSEGRELNPARNNEVIVSKEFADAHEYRPGDAVTATLNGRRRDLVIAAIAQSPEFIYVIGPGELIPDPERFTVMWMQRGALEHAFDMDGAFNDVALTLAPDADEDEVIDRLDNILAPYGGVGAYPRADQISHAFFQSEIDGLVSMGATLPPIFLIVAAFMLYVLLARLIETEREQIGLLKSFGYSDLEVGLHYLKMALGVGVLGGLGGAALGLWAGRALSVVYTEFYSLPFMILEPPGSVIGVGVLVAVLAAGGGALLACRRALSLEPAVAMRPPAPATFGRGLADSIGLMKALTVASRIIVRNIERRPVRAGLTTLGVAAGCATIIGTTFMLDAMEVLTDLQFYQAQRQDVALSLAYPREDGVLHEIARLPGVLAVEGARMAPVEAVNGARTERTGVQGLPARADLNRPLDADGVPISLPPEGVVMSSYLAQKLGLSLGDAVTLRVLDGRRPTLTPQIVQIAEDYMGTSVYMQRAALNRAMNESPTITSAYVTIDPTYRAAFFQAVKDSPLIQGAAIKDLVVEEMEATMQENVGIYTFIASLFAGSICFGVVYNAARISLSERGRELASLRVLGFTKGEVSYVLLGELALLTLVALPLGCVLGYGMAMMITTFYDAELFRPPLIVTSARYATAILYTVGFATLSGLIVRRRIEHLDLIEVLKTRE
ncbi:MAG: FtsX-like permease family protein [Maricaulaceae bacterium]